IERCRDAIATVTRPKRTPRQRRHFGETVACSEAEPRGRARAHAGVKEQSIELLVKRRDSEQALGADGERIERLKLRRPGATACTHPRDDVAIRRRIAGAL